MKKLFLVVSILLFLADTGWCLTIGNIDVGKADIFTGYWGYLNENPTGETNWVNSVLGSGTVIYSVKQEENIPYYLTNQVDTYAFQMVPYPPVSEYFLIKNGNYVALFQNIASTEYGVFNLNDLSGVSLTDSKGNTVSLADVMNLDGTTISHITRFVDSTTPVPEPSTIVLLGVGIIGFAGTIRRKMMR